MKTILGIIILGLFSTQLYAACTYSLNSDKLFINWEAYKTLAKVGVKGSFDQVKFDGIKTSSSAAKLFNNLKFEINTHSVNSGNPSRDVKLKKFFFTTDDKPLIIKGRSQEYSKKSLEINLMINKVKKTIPLSITVTNSKITASGNIDLFDFGLHNSLAGINKACSLLHSGKTWNDVAISITAPIIKSCK